MNYEIMPNSCRICLKKCKKMRSLYLALEEGDEPPNEMLQQLTGIELEEADAKDELPKCICKNCELSLNMAYQFREKVLRTQRVIEIYCKRFLSEHNVEEPLHVKSELEELIEFQEHLDEDYEQENAIMQMTDMKVEELEVRFNDADNEDDELLSEIGEIVENDVVEVEDDSNVEYLDETLAELDNASVDSGSIDVELEARSQSPMLVFNRKLSSSAKTRITNNKRFKSNAANKLQLRMRRNHSNEKNDDSEAEQLQLATETVTDESVSSTRVRVSKRVDDEGGHICDICGNIFAKRGRMMEHRRRHDTELRYGCELCDKRFHLREKLRKHMFMHSGSKPLKCSFCSRTFFYESVKKAHEAVHNGHKPYVCEICNKAFAYSHALKKHKLIHADIKLYHCEYCDKDFRLDHHMKQHQETKIHQNAVRSAEEARLAAVASDADMDADAATSNQAYN